MSLAPTSVRATGAAATRPAGARTQMVLGLNVLGLGQRPASWQAEGLERTAFIDSAHWIGVAREAERGGFDALFLADTPALNDPSARPAGVLEPTSLLSVLATATERIGLVGTLTTTYNDPVELAARILTLDHLSEGRAGWNVVTTADPQVGANFGIAEGLDRDTRYRRAQDFVAFVRDLWDAAGVRETPIPDAFGTGTAQLSLPQSPQSRPVLVQAGGSPAGRELAARYADAVFTAEMTLDSALSNYALVKQIAADAGRHPAEVSILPGFALVIGSTEAEATALYDRWEELGPSDYSANRLSGILGVDIADFDLDAELPEHVTKVPEDTRSFTASLSFRATTVQYARQNRLTVRQLLRQYGGYGHPIIVGTPEQVADTLAEWFLAGAADGFNLMPDAVPQGLTTVIDEVLPLLRARGLFRDAYAEPTLRGRLHPSPRTKD